MAKPKTCYNPASISKNKLAEKTFTKGSNILVFKSTVFCAFALAPALVLLGIYTNIDQ